MGSSWAANGQNGIDGAQCSRQAATGWGQLGKQLREVRRIGIGWVIVRVSSSRSRLRNEPPTTTKTATGAVACRAASSTGKAFSAAAEAPMTMMSPRRRLSSQASWQSFVSLVMPRWWDPHHTQVIARPGGLEPPIR